MAKQKNSDLSIPSLYFTGMPAFYRCEPGWSWDPPPLPDYDLWFVQDGQGTLCLEGKSYTVRAGSCFILAPGSRPSGRQHLDYRLWVFACHFDFGGEKIPALWKKTRGGELRESQFVSDLARRCVAAYHRGDAWNQENSRRLLEMMVWHVDGELRTAGGEHREDLVEAVIRAVREEPGAPWTIQEMARRAGLSPSQFTRRFRTRTNVSPNHFVILARLERARQLLRETDMTVGAIADALGYRDPHFFCRQFKTFTGQTPGSIRG